jgi:hypothetical protein
MTVLPMPARAASSIRLNRSGSEILVCSARFPGPHGILIERHLAECGIFERGVVETQRDRSQPLCENLVGAEACETGAFLSTI